MTNSLKDLTPAVDNDEEAVEDTNALPKVLFLGHRAGTNLYWKWISQKHGKVGRKPTSKELRELIFRMVPTDDRFRLDDEKRPLPFRSEST